MKKRPPHKDAGQFSEISPYKIFLPILLGLGVIVFLLSRDFDRQSLADIDWDWSTFLFVFLAILCAFGRQWAYMWRIRVLSDRELNWRQSFDVIGLWEFSSAVTPTRVGGIAVAVFLLLREKISAGKATTIVLVTVFLDSAIFILLTIFFWLVYGNVLLSPKYAGENIQSLYDGGGWVYTFIVAFALMFFYSAFIGFGLFVNPKSFNWLLTNVFSLPIVKRWKEKARTLGEDVETASREIKTRGWKYWGDACMATFLTWTFRFLVVNFLIVAVLSVSDHLLLYGRQLALYQILVLTPTPGASGVADFAFKDFFFDFIGNEGLASAIGAIWRLITYYPYLILGVLILPAWIKRTAKN